jgi:hypothetical protein
MLTASCLIDALSFWTTGKLRRPISRHRTRVPFKFVIPCRSKWQSPFGKSGHLALWYMCVSRHVTSIGKVPRTKFFTPSYTAVGFRALGSLCETARRRHFDAPLPNKFKHQQGQTSAVNDRWRLLWPPLILSTWRENWRYSKALKTTNLRICLQKPEIPC